MQLQDTMIFLFLFLSAINRYHKTSNMPIETRKKINPTPGAKKLPKIAKKSTKTRGTSKKDNMKSAKKALSVPAKTAKPNPKDLLSSPSPIENPKISNDHPVLMLVSPPPIENPKELNDPPVLLLTSPPPIEVLLLPKMGPHYR